MRKLELYFDMSTFRLQVDPPRFVFEVSERHAEHTR